MKQFYFVISPLVLLLFAAGLFRRISPGILLIRTLFSVLIIFASVSFFKWLWVQHDQFIQRQKQRQKKRERNFGQVEPDLIASLSQDHERSASIASKLGLPLKSGKT